MASELAAKRLELLKTVVPRISRVSVLAYFADPIAPLQVKALKDAARLAWRDAAGPGHPDRQ